MATGLLGGWLPTYDTSIPAGYNQNQFMSDQSTGQLAGMLGLDGWMKTNPKGPVAPPPQNILDFGQYGGNAGLTYDMIAGSDSDLAKRRLADWQQTNASGMWATGMNSDPSMDRRSYQAATPFTGLPAAGAPAGPARGALGDIAGRGGAPAATAGAAAVTPTPSASPLWKPSTANAVPNSIFGNFVQVGTDRSQGQFFPLPNWNAQPSSQGGPMFAPPNAAGPGQAGSPAPPPAAPTTSLPAPGAAQGNTADQFLASLPSNMGYLSNIAQNAGFATDATPAWQAMVQAMQRNIDRGAADLAEQFNVSGGRFSNAFGTAMTDYQNQARLNQNSTLGQLQVGTQEAARGRELGAANLLAQLGFQGASQLSSQDFQALMQQLQQQYGAAQAMLGAGGGAANALNQAAMQGAFGLNQNAMQGAMGMFGAENAASMSEIQRQLALQQMMMSGGANLSNLWQSNLGLGSQLGGQQYGLSQDQINRMYQEWLRIQPQYNPMLSYLFSAATGYPPQYTPGYQPSMWGQIISAAGQLGAGAAVAACDIRLKNQIEHNPHGLRELKSLNTYKYHYIFDQAHSELGVMAQEVREHIPEAVREQYGHLVVNYHHLTATLINAVKELDQRVSALEGAK